MQHKCGKLFTPKYKHMPTGNMSCTFWIFLVDILRENEKYHLEWGVDSLDTIWRIIPLFTLNFMMATLVPSSHSTSPTHWAHRTVQLRSVNRAGPCLETTVPFGLRLETAANWLQGMVGSLLKCRESFAWKQEHLSINFCTQHWNLTTLHDSLPVALQQGCFEGTRNWHAFVMPFQFA